VSNLITDWRAALVTLLTTAFPDAEVMSGQRVDEVSRDKARIAVFWPGTGESSEVNFINPRMTIRFWAKHEKTLLKPVPADDGPLEQAAWDLATTLQPVLATLLNETDPAYPGFYFRVVQIDPVRDEFAVEAQLLGLWKNPAFLTLTP
jgi:hypothetical protein